MFPSTFKTMENGDAPFTIVSTVHLNFIRDAIILECPFEWQHEFDMKIFAENSMNSFLLIGVDNQILKQDLSDAAMEPEILYEDLNVSVLITGRSN